MKDESKIESKWYAPVVLVNGAEGIGIGWILILTPQTLLKNDQR